MLAGLYILNLLLLVALLTLVLRQGEPSRFLVALALAEITLVLLHTLLFASVVLLS